MSAMKAKVVKKESDHVYVVRIGNLIKLAHVNQLRKSILKPVIIRNDSCEEKQKDREDLKIEIKKKRNDKWNLKQEELRKSARIRQRPEVSYKT